MTLEKAGFSYDSTVGYNETIGYRAGTAQVFKHPNVDHLLELPLHIMDTALFYPSYMNLSDEQAHAAILQLIENATRFGGVLTDELARSESWAGKIMGRTLSESAPRLALQNAMVCHGNASRFLVSEAARDIIRQCCTGWRNHPGAASYQLDCR